MSSDVVDYKSTVRLPQTEFPMKGDLPIREPQIIEMWDSKKIYQRLQEKNKSKQKFTLPDGPPYANGAIHIGHALNKNLKDFIIKYKSMRGFCAPFIPGWDCHGLPIEHKVMKDLSAKKQVKTDHEILGLCREEAMTWINQQRTQFKRLGVLADWENPYLTMSKDYEAEEIREFARAFQKGVIYRGEKPVYWNWTLKTALADAEVEYHDHKSPSIYVKFPITDAETLSRLGNPKAPTSMVIWTTTPWTLPANTGICLHPDLKYAVYSTANENLVFAEALQEFVEKDTGLTLNKGKVIQGSELENMKARHPWIQRDSTIVLGLHVTSDAGTGCVHTAPGHGADDFKVGQKYKLQTLCPVNDGGCFTAEVEEFAGQNIFKANPLIVEKLKNSGHLLGFKEITHSYPHCWRSKTPLIFRTTPQWFIGIDLEGSEIRKKTLAEVQKIQFFPEWGRARFNAMMEGRPDWCLSRQRIWGVPIPILYNEQTGEPLADYTVMMKIADVVEKGGIEAYWSTPAAELAGKPGYKHGKDILDVWFDSGICHAAVQKKRTGLALPADIYLEGSDQHRGWFNTSMLSSMATNEIAPFKALLTHGFVTDPQGRKMSKSLGNVVDPQEVYSKSGAEIIRLWVASADYGTDISCGKDELTRVTESYRRMRNSMRYLLGAVHDFNPQTDSVPYDQLTQIDQWALNELYELHEKVTTAYDNYEFYKVYHALNVFFTVTLSAVYFDVLKDRLYTWKADGTARRGSQTVLHLMTDYLLKMMAPILSFLAEECYGYLKGKTEDSIFLCDYPIAKPEWKRTDLKELFEEILKIRSDVQKEIEILRASKTIGASLEASIEIAAEGSVLSKLRQISDLRELLIVSNVHLKDGKYSIKVEKSGGEKCVRCWTYTTEISTKVELPNICPKCVEALT